MENNKEYYNELAKKGKKGDEAAVMKIITGLRPMIKRYINRYCSVSYDLNEDMIQDGYKLILECIRTYNPSVNNSFAGYVLTKLKYAYIHKSSNYIAMSSLNETIMRDGWEIELEKSLISEERGPEEEIIYRIELKEEENNLKNLNKAMKTLSAKNKSVMEMMYRDMKSGVEIAEKYGITKQQVSKIKTNSIKKIKIFSLKFQ